MNLPTYRDYCVLPGDGRFTVFRYEDGSFKVAIVPAVGKTAPLVELDRSTLEDLAETLRLALEAKQ